MAGAQGLLERGFDAAAPELPENTYGRGWYFSKYASYAHHFSCGSGYLLLTLVAAIVVIMLYHYRIVLQEYLNRDSSK